jgi:hypothetical protein
MPDLPLTLVFRVVNHPRLPFALVCRVGDSRWLPHAILIIIPVVWLLGMLISQKLWHIPVLGLHILRIWDLCLVHPILRLFGIRILYQDATSDMQTVKSNTIDYCSPTLCKPKIVEIANPCSAGERPGSVPESFVVIRNHRLHKGFHSSPLDHL